MLFRICVLSLGVYVLGSIYGASQAHAYVYGLKSADNTVQNIQHIEKYFPQASPDIISMIYDGWSLRAKQQITRFAQIYGTGKILHLTLSPDGLSMQQISDGRFDQQYADFFALIHQLKIKVIFRTMHEMNGGRYAWSGQPKLFIKTRKHLWRLSRLAGLDQHNILFDFSVVHHDLPSLEEIPSHTNTFVPCTPDLNIQTQCLRMEDYYPGHKYVDIVGVTFYNRGKGRHHRKWLSPVEIIEDPLRSTWTRLHKFAKPLIVDEVASTAVNYAGVYDPKLSLQIYETDYSNKNQRLVQLTKWAKAQKKLVGLIYFNVDYTAGYQHQTIGESDRSVIDFNTSKVYTGVYTLAQGGEDLSTSKLNQLFTK